MLDDIALLKYSNWCCILSFANLKFVRFTQSKKIPTRPSESEDLKKNHINSSVSDNICCFAYYKIRTLRPGTKAVLYPVKFKYEQGT